MSLRVFPRLCLLTMTLVWIAFAAVPQIALAVIKEVTLFPQSARIEAVRIVAPQISEKGQPQIVVVLPAATDPESFSAALDAPGPVRISDIQMKSVLRTDEKAIAALRDELRVLQNEKRELLSKIHAQDAQIQFWQTQAKAKAKTVSEADVLSRTIGKNIRVLHQDKFSFQTSLEAVEKRISDAQNRLNQAAGKKETAWEAIIGLSGGTVKELKLHYSYLMEGCGWLPHYRIEALPASKSVSFQWDAEMWQSSGRDWKDIRLNVATLQPPRSLTPPDMPPWIIQQRQTGIFKQALRREKAPDSAVMASSPDTAPKESVLSSYSVWSLGVKSLAAGDRLRLPIKSESWPAEFLFLARPGLSPQVFVSAQIQLPSSSDIPAGQASFLIDGALVGKRDFSLAGSEAVLYFGVSPLITVSSKTMTDQSGARSLFQNRQTRRWHRLIEAVNASASELKVRIEEPVPQSRDERIKLTFRYDPEPSEKNAFSFIWEFDIPAGAKKGIDMFLDVDAPGEMDIDFGWRH